MYIRDVCITAFWREKISLHSNSLVNMADNVNDKGDSRTIQQIVRAVVANLSALHNSAGLPPRATLSGSSASTVGNELNNSFQIPRGQATQRGSFINNFNAKKDYSVRSNKGKFTTSRKGKSPAVKADLIYKDVCLLPSPEWTEVPRRKAKAKLVSSGMYVDAWQLDKNRSEAEVRSRVSSLFHYYLFVNGEEIE